MYPVLPSSSTRIASYGTAVNVPFLHSSSDIRHDGYAAGAGPSMEHSASPLRMGELPIARGKDGRQVGPDVDHHPASSIARPNQTSGSAYHPISNDTPKLQDRPHPHTAETTPTAPPEPNNSSSQADDPDALLLTNKRKRKRTGCYTCRRRKKACDEAQPFCTHCQRLDIPCVYPKLGQKRPRLGLFTGEGAQNEGNLEGDGDAPDQDVCIGAAGSGDGLADDAGVKIGCVGPSAGPGKGRKGTESIQEGKGRKTKRPHPTEDDPINPSAARQVHPTRILSMPSSSFSRDFSAIPVPATEVRQVYLDRRMGEPPMVGEEGEKGWKYRKVDDHRISKGANELGATTTVALGESHSLEMTSAGQEIGSTFPTEGHGGSSRPPMPRWNSRRSPALRPGGLDMSTGFQPPYGMEYGSVAYMDDPGQHRMTLGTFSRGYPGHAGKVNAQGALLTAADEEPEVQLLQSSGSTSGHHRPLPVAGSSSSNSSSTRITTFDLPAIVDPVITSGNDEIMDLFAMMHSPSAGPEQAGTPGAGASVQHRTGMSDSVSSAPGLSPYTREWLNLSPSANGSVHLDAASPAGHTIGLLGAMDYNRQSGMIDLETSQQQVNNSEDILEVQRLPEHMFHGWHKAVAAAAPSIPRPLTPGGMLGNQLSSSSMDILGASLPAWTWSHVPALIDYFVNGFGPIISVLGIVSKDAFIQSLLPVACESPLLLPALVGWSASHLAPIGEPYASIAKLATSVTEQRASALIRGGLNTDNSASIQDKIWIMMILGGIGICQGNVKVWNQSLPRIRSLLGHLMRSRRPRCVFSDGELALALGCIYYDISASLATTRDPGVPLDIYDVFIRQSISRPEVHMGVAAPLFKILAEITVLAEEASSQAELGDNDERFEKLAQILETAKTLSHRIDLIEIHSRTLSSIAAWRQDEQSFDGQHLITAFTVFKLAAQAYLRQTVYRSPAANLEAQYSLVKMTAAIKQVLHSPGQSQMLFPLFLAGCDAVRQGDRDWVKQTFQRLHTRTGTGNIQTIFTLLLGVWERNDGGLTWVDWREVAEGMDNEVSFA